MCLFWEYSNLKLTLSCYFLFLYLQEEEIEQFSMNFTSFCDNKVSCFSVIRYLCWGILKHKDPLVIKVWRIPVCMFGVDSVMKDGSSSE